MRGAGACGAERACDGAVREEESLVEALVVVGVSDDKLLQVLNHRRAKEKEREMARAAAAWEEAAERYNNAHTTTCTGRVSLSLSWPGRAEANRGYVAVLSKPAHLSVP